MNINLLLKHSQIIEVSLNFNENLKNISKWHTTVELNNNNIFENKIILNLYSEYISVPFNFLSRPINTLYDGILVKSSLQKAVRRRNISAAVNLAWYMIRDNLISFLRRLPIIIIEDSILHIDYIYIIWLMIAIDKGWFIDKEQIEKLLSIVFEISSSTHHELLVKKKKEFFISYFKKEDLSLNDNIIISCFGMLIRTCYDDIKDNDIDMLLGMSIIWNNRRNCIFKNEWQNKLLFNHSFISIDNIKNDLNDNDKLIEGVDFYCFPSIIDSIKFNFTFSEDDIKQAIWHWRSGVYCKSYISTLDHLNPNNTIYFEDPLFVKTRNQTKHIWDSICHLLNNISLQYWSQNSIPRMDPPLKKQKINIKNFFDLKK